MKANILITIALLFVFSQAANADDRTNRQIFDKVYSAVKDDALKPTGELTAEIALQLLGTPYVASSIEQTPEDLRVYLDRTDCILFVELCCSFALTVKSDAPCYETLLDNIREMRYRNGIVNGYASRIHYTSEWLQQNESRGILREYTQDFGETVPQEFSFMSSHPECYPQLKGDCVEIEKIKEMENRLNVSGPYYAIGKGRLSQGDVDIREGDIICFLSSTKGIDIKHVALAHKVAGQMHFIHASSLEGKVVVSEQTLAEYAKSGVRLARMK